ncbi:MAG: type II toxin-antitoxin system RelE/ParE family toxin [Gemmatimonadetes bacterium]|nr:type II toxin-antitoxin system RelE/ParE family toxin [Gemmatimonadota bacterium]
MSAFSLTQRARREIGEAATRLVRKSGDLSASDVLLESLFNAFSLIATMPRIGRARRELGRGLRSHVVDGYTIFYRARHGLVEITRVIHHRRNLSQAFAPTRRRIRLTRAFERAVWTRVDCGLYATTGQVLAACIAALAEREARDAAELGLAVQVGLDQYERGEFSDGEAAFARIRQRLEENSARRHKKAREDPLSDPQPD